MNETLKTGRVRKLLNVVFFIKRCSPSLGKPSGACLQTYSSGALKARMLQI
jgi:hypothetical protein